MYCVIKIAIKPLNHKSIVLIEQIACWLILVHCCPLRNTFKIAHRLYLFIHLAPFFGEFFSLKHAEYHLYAQFMTISLMSLNRLIDLKEVRSTKKKNTVKYNKTSSHHHQ